MKRILYLITLACVVILFAGCPFGQQPFVTREDAINQNLQKATKIESVDTITDQCVHTVTQLPDSTCTRDYYKATLGFTKLFCLDPATDVIWPGALLDGATIKSGGYKPMTLARSSLKISCSITNTNAPVSGTMQNPCLSESRDVLNSIVFKNKDANVPAQMDFTFTELYSFDHLLLKLGSSMSPNSKNTEDFLKNHFNWDGTKKTKALLEFMQVYYSCDIDQPSKPSDFFSDSATWDDIKSQMDSMISPGYVASINYGRLILLFIQSDTDIGSIGSVFSSVFTNATKTAGDKSQVEISPNNLDIIKSCRIDVVILGGDSGTAAETIADPSNFAAWLTDKKNTTVSTPVVPLSYNIRYLKDNSNMLLILNDEKTIVDCLAPTSEPTVTPEPVTPEPITPVPTMTPAPLIPVLAITQAGTNIPCGGNYNFPNVNEGWIGAPVTFTLQNTGNTPLQITNPVYLSGSNAFDFAIDNSTVPTSIPAGESSSFTVTFKPQSYGGKMAQIVINCNDPDKSNCQITISGKGNKKVNGTKEFTTTGASSWTPITDGINLDNLTATIDVVGGGGGGGGGSSGHGDIGSGGGGGGAGQHLNFSQALNKNTTYAIYIGKGGPYGAGGSSTHTGHDGSIGELTMFTDAHIAPPGSGGTRGGNDPQELGNGGIGYLSGSDENAGKGGNGGSNSYIGTVGLGGSAGKPAVLGTYGVIITPGSPGGTGGNASANSGNGGGGGGSSTSTDKGADGGNGGSGYIRIAYEGYQLVQ